MPHDSQQARDQEPQAAPVIPFAERGVIVAGQRIASAMNDVTPAQALEQARLARIPLVVLPELLSAWEEYRPLLEHFAPERRIFTLDWPGFGASARPAPDAFAYTVPHLAEVLAGWMDSLGIARAAIVGFGVGAAIAARYAVAHPGRAGGLGLIGPLGFARLGGLLGRVMATPALLRRIEPTLTTLGLGPTTEETQAISARHKTQRASADHAATLAAAAALLGGLNASAEETLTLARQITAPASVLRGALDPFCAAGDARRVAEALGEHGALEVTLPDAGHYPFLQQPARSFQVIEGLLTTAEANV
ncbi:MAG: alpha/beta hydrolase [Ktedonobacterales bacterium]